MGKIIDCKNLSNTIREEVKFEVNKLPKKLKLVVIKIGDDEASKIYVNQKEKACHEVGIEFERIEYPDTIAKSDIFNKIKELSDDLNTTSVLLQLPLPNSLAKYKDEFINAIEPNKDVDGINAINKMKLSQNIKDAIVPCTALGIMRIIDQLINQKEITTLTGKNVVVIGKSDLIGRPLSYLLYNETTITHCDINTDNLGYYTKNADIVITATGCYGLITSSMLKKGCILIDAGITKVDNKVVGDAESNIGDNDILYTPVPGGVGVMTVTGVLLNILECYKRQN